MRNLSRHAGPNRMMFLLLIPCLLLSALRAKAEETALPEGKRPGVTLQVEMDLVSISGAVFTKRAPVCNRD